MNDRPAKAQWYRALEEKQGKAEQQKIAAASVAVCGCGGLGSNIAVNLARAGVGRLILIDFDKVELSNMHRQQYKFGQIGEAKAEALKANLGEIAPYVDVVAHVVRLDEENVLSLIDDADIVCEAFDRAENKAMLVNTVLEQRPRKYIVAASGMAGDGPANEIRSRRLGKRFYLCGDGHSDVERENCLLPSRVQLCAAHQAHAVLRIILEQFDV